MPGQVPAPSAPALADLAEPRPAVLAPVVRRRYLRPTDSDAWHVGFSPTGEALPDALTDVLLRGSHAIRSSKRAEAQRLERAAAVANHVDAQIRDFLDFCAAERLVPPVTVRASGGRPRRASGRSAEHPLPGVDPHLGAGPLPRDTWVEEQTRFDGRRPPGRFDVGPGPFDEGPGARRAEDGDDQDQLEREEHGSASHHRRAERNAAGRPGEQDPRRRHRPRRRERLQAWPLLYWRCESFPAAGRSLHLFVEPGGRTFEGHDDPAPLTVLGREVQVWPVDAAAIVAGMAEVDARRCALQLVHGMAHLLWRSGVGL
ncbi:hypothetical protein [Frankia sp. AgB32]|uniref:hypothetical protein n=1 Tax=Frankia sp. AgB32 TaxID=631119 RepID=UPI002010C106|nr:hypothetical protein [Frankia sp. AgB32]MCK9894292.1 hypothetical protein [Frankia sp. AgB32]